ncbi:UvrD-helicase domain-containing protein [Pseudomonas aeruginosa]|uniref:UvrD-helicase domain-containing protein n=1 Tax=Pseudomonas aeruginosa TaxID=287 RepID=UPI00053EB213|nr:ATP-dependent helicase [Pseudomonas aeruginosa]KSD76619.1 ATP-dependent DNA helicase [Pseudomonas aeruginosa]MBG5164161.1 ATP-dependent helicase [Pseudomonas aeruginosa]MBV6363775.1 ATP-dependent helicase [Pseudomonas aeruginosa]MCT5064330.1 ATP-dependent helicase [Pseudomonas aeruginosa]MCU9466626.1 ATP-dependent helicase [Pseudomonas aeruginosa]
MDLSAEQQAIVDAPLVPLAVIACAGSGKTATAVRRLVEMRRLLAEDRGRVALLSFSNVAVNTFRRGYQGLAQKLPDSAGRGRVDIDTLDGFITSHILRPHAFRTMGAFQAAFLVTGSEPFLAGFTCKTGNFPIPINQVKVGIQGGEPFFYYDYRGNPELLDQNAAKQVVTRLGRTGAYTHDLGRYWCYQTLRNQPEVLRALVRRYPHVLVDESQDIGTLHQAILELLADTGVQMSLIGDPNQGIYEFAGADGNFLRNYGNRGGVDAYALTRNYRSLPPILNLANNLSGRHDEPNREAEVGTNGAYFIGYSEAELPRLVDAFLAEVASLGLRTEDAAILCRGASLADQLAGVIAPSGRGTVKLFVEAALHRDMHSHFLDAFKAVSRAVISLLENPPKELLTKLISPSQDASLRELRRRLWTFTRDPELGLPSSELAAATEWHRLLLEHVRTLLNGIQQDFGLAPIDRLGNKLARTELPDGPLNGGVDLAGEARPRIRIDTVHQAKGESIDAVLYVATRQHIQAMLDGVQTELGRIGYVAVTRARNLFWLGVPSKALKALRPALLAAGFQEAGKRKV